jgi:hypothetical protein
VNDRISQRDLDPLLNKAVEELNVRLSKIEHEASISAGPCTECKWHHCLNPIVPIDSDYVCKNPLVSLPSFDATSHEPSFSWVRLDSARARGPCGPEGLLWEPIPVHRDPKIWIKVIITLFVLAFAAMIYSCSTQLS